MTGYWTFSLIGAVVLLYLLFGKSASARAPKSKQTLNPPSAQTEEPVKNSSVVLAVFFLFLLFGCIVAGIGALFELIESRHRSVGSSNPQSLVVASRGQHYSTDVVPGTETAVRIPVGMSCEIAPANYNQNVWVRYEGTTEKFKDWKGRPSGGDKKMPGMNYIYVQSAETYSVKVNVHIYPTP